MATCATCALHGARWQARSKANPTDTWLVCQTCRDQAKRLGSAVQYRRLPTHPEEPALPLELEHVVPPLFELETLTP